MLNTPINSLAEQITNGNFHEVFPCIKLLIRKFADINLPNQNGMTPMMNILKNRNLNLENKKAVIKYILDNTNDVDLDNDETRALLNEIFPFVDIENEWNKRNHFFGNKVRNSSNVEVWNISRLFEALKNEREDEFLTGLRHVVMEGPQALNGLFTTSEQRETLLVAAISKDLTNAAQVLIKLGADVNYSMQMGDNSWSPLESAVAHGHWKCLDMLLQSPEIEINSAPILPLVVRHFEQKYSKESNYEKCFEMLLDHQQIDLNQHDSNDFTALHYAVKCNNHEAILELLNKGAYIGMQCKSGQLAIEDIDANLFKKHLDSCVTTNGLRPNDENYEIDFNYKNLVSHVKNPKDKSVTNEMIAIAYISKSEDLKKLIMHPLIRSFVSIRWIRLALYFWSNFVLCACWAVTSILYILVYYNNNYSNAFSYCLTGLIFLLNVYVVVRELSQFLFSPRAYLTSMDNYIEFSLVVLISLILFDMYSDSWRRTFAASTISLMAVEFFLICGSLPFWSFSLYYMMFKKVASSFLKSLSLYSIMLLAFSLAFFTLLHEPTETNKPEPGTERNEKQQKSNDDDDTDFNHFPSIGLSIVKTFV